MKAAIYRGKKDVVIEERPMPRCGPKDVLLKVLYASVCGSDAAVYRDGPGTGHRITVGEEFGHEAVCRVSAVGADVTSFQAGQRVYPYPLLVTGDTRRAGTMGAFSEYILAPGARPGVELYPIPDKIDDRTAALIESFTVGTRATRRAQPQKGEKAIVFGAGTIGIATAIALKEFGCRQVMVCDVSGLRLEKARNLGFTVCNPAATDVSKAAADQFGAAPGLDGLTADADIFLDAAEAGGLLELFRSMGKIGSRMVVTAVRAGKWPLDILHMTYAQKSLIGSGGYMPEDVADVMEIMAGGRYDISSIITHEFPHRELEQALNLAGQPEQALNVLIRYD